MFQPSPRSSHPLTKLEIVVAIRSIGACIISNLRHTRLANELLPEQISLAARRQIDIVALMYNACVLYKYMYKSRVHVQLKEFLYFKLYEIILITYVLARCIVTFFLPNVIPSKKIFPIWLIYFYTKYSKNESNDFKTFFLYWKNYSNDNLFLYIFIKQQHKFNNNNFARSSDFDNSQSVNSITNFDMAV